MKYWPKLAMLVGVASNDQVANQSAFQETLWMVWYGRNIYASFLNAARADNQSLQRRQA